MMPQAMLAASQSVGRPRSSEVGSNKALPTSSFLFFKYLNLFFFQLILWSFICYISDEILVISKQGKGKAGAFKQQISTRSVTEMKRKEMREKRNLKEIKRKEIGKKLKRKRK